MSLVVGDVLKMAARLRPATVAVTLCEQQLSFEQVAARMAATAHRLQTLGIGGGDRIVWWSDISLTGVTLFFAAGELGAVFVPLNPKMSAVELGRSVKYLCPQLIVVDAAREVSAQAVADRLGIPVHVATTDWDVQVEGAGAHSTATDALTEKREPSEPHVIFLTSGSTGHPKGVVLSHRASVLRSASGGDRSLAGGGGGDVCMFPLYHMAGWYTLLCAWASYRPIHLVDSTDGQVLAREVSRWQAATMYCIPAVWRRVLDAAPAGSLDTLRHAQTGTSNVSQQLFSEMRERMPNARITVSYGSTEAGVCMTLGDWDVERKPGSVGFPALGVEAKLVEGELCLRSDALMDGYFHLPRETGEVLDQDGWYHSGDLAEIDPEGYLHVVGRRGEIIRTGGESISPNEVEEVLNGHPAVRRVAVVGIPDELWGEVVCAAVIVVSGAEPPTVSDFRSFVQDRLAPFKFPRRVVVVDELPLTPATGQVQRRRLREAILSASDGLARIG